MSKQLFQVEWNNISETNHTVVNSDPIPFNDITYDNEIFEIPTDTNVIYIPKGNKGTYIVSFDGVFLNKGSDIIELTLVLTDGVSTYSFVGTFFSLPEAKNISGSIVVDIPDEDIFLGLINSGNNIVFDSASYPTMVIYEIGESDDEYKYLTSAAMLHMKNQAGKLVTNGNYLDFAYDDELNPGIVTNPDVIAFYQNQSVTDDSVLEIDFEFTSINLYKDGFYSIDWWVSINGADAPNYLDLTIIDVPTIFNPYNNIYT